MADKEKIEKLLHYLERKAKEFDDYEPCSGDDWCEKHCGKKIYPTKECFRRYLLGE